MIGLGVPLDLAFGHHLQDDRFVYLRVCDENEDDLYHSGKVCIYFVFSSGF